MSAYFDLRSELFRRVFRNALPYAEYLATGNSRERAAWARAKRRCRGCRTTRRPGWIRPAGS